MKAMDPPTTAPLPNFRTEFTEPFSTTGVDFAGPLYYKIGKNKTSKAYVALFTCFSTTAVHLSLCKEMTITEFNRVMKKFVARRVSPKLIDWRFKLSRSPWGGGHENITKLAY